MKTERLTITISAFVVTIISLALIPATNSIPATAQPAAIETSELTAVNISNNEGFSAEPALAVDTQGNITVLWQDDTSNAGYYDIYYSSKSAAGSWSTPQTIPDPAESSGPPCLVADGLGNLYAAWSQQDIYFSQNNGGGWTSPLNISGASSIPFIGACSIDVDGAGRVHITTLGLTSYGKPDPYYFVRDTDGSWVSPVPISIGSERSEAPVIAVDSFGNAHTVWSRLVSGSGYELLYSRKPVGGPWSTPFLVSAGGLYRPDIATDTQGNVHIVWEEWVAGPSIFYRMRSSSGSWSTSVDISGDLLYAEPAITVGGDGTLHVVGTKGVTGGGNKSTIPRNQVGVIGLPQCPLSPASPT